LEEEEYREQQIWDLKYISTSDEEDNDSSEEGSGSGSGEESDEEEKKKEEEKNKNAKSLEEVKIQIDESQALIKANKPTVEEEFNEEVLDQDPKKIWKLKLGKNDNVPEIA
jgi:hypothetical protein